MKEYRYTLHYFASKFDAQIIGTNSWWHLQFLKLTLDWTTCESKRKIYYKKCKKYGL